MIDGTEHDCERRTDGQNWHSIHCTCMVWLRITRKLSYRKDDRAMRRMYGCHENFRESLTIPMATFPEIPKFLMGSLPIERINT